MQATPEFGLLPRDRTFARSLPAFLLPYLAYVALASLPHGLLTPAGAEALRFAVVAALMLAFRKSYSLGPRLTVRQAVLAFGAAFAALALWFFLYRAALALPFESFRTRLDDAAATEPGPAYAALRALNSVLLVPLFEEWLCRAYVAELMSGLPRGGPFSARLAARMDERPASLAAPPLAKAAVWGAALVFVLGHGVAAWPAALAYFAFTTALYRKTGSFRACVMVHALVNLAIAVLVQLDPALRFLWY